MENQEMYPLIIALACLLVFLLLLTIILFILIHQRKMLIKEKAFTSLKRNKEMEVFKASAIAEERERSKIAANLHDEIHPILVLLKQNLTCFLDSNVSKKELETNSATNSKLLDKVISGLNDCVYDLSPSHLVSVGLIPSLQDYFLDLKHIRKIESDFHIMDEFSDEAFLSHFQQLNLYRMVLELVNNSLRHSGCTTINCTLSRQGAHLFEIELTHDGEGLNQKNFESLLETSTGVGLKSIKARSLLLGAELHFAAEKEMSIIRIQLPLTEKEWK